MSFPSLLTESYVILPRTAVTGTGAKDRYGNPQATWPDGPTVPGRIHQVQSFERNDSRDTVTSDWQLLLMPSVTITAYDRVRDTYGRVFEVVGEPKIATTPRGPHHIEVQLRHITAG